MKKLVLILFILLFGTLTYAQIRQISGTVKSATGDTLVSATVRVQGSTDGTVTNTDGFYTLSTNTTGQLTLVFSYTGYKEKKVVVGDTQTIVNVKLADLNNNLNEMVVIGYQTVKRKDLTGSVSSVTANDIKDVPVNSAAEALEGRLAGVEINSTEGEPGADVTIKIRGGNSITQDNSPLYIIDGIQVENGLAAISPQDIASIDVLKDASATAIYGARGANGVVIITTKRGTKTGKAKISYNGFIGVQKIAKELEVLSPYDFVLYQYERSRNNSQDSASFAGKYGTTWDTLINYKKTPAVNWQDQLFGRQAMMQSHNASMNGGNESTQYNLSITSNTQQGIMLNSGYDRKLVNFNIDHKFSKKLRVSFNSRYNTTVVDGAGTSNPGSSAVNFLRQTIRYRPFLKNGQNISDYDQDYANETNSNSLSLVNPILLNNAQYKKNNSSILNISGYAEYTLNDYFSFRTTLGTDITNTRLNQFNDTLTSDSKLNGSNLPIAYITTGVRNTINNSNVVSFSNMKKLTGFSDKNKFTALLGQEIYESHYVGYSQEARYFPAGITPDHAFGNLSLGTPTPLSNASIDTGDRLVSFFGRVNYTYNQKYLFTATYRLDGSSKFAPGNQWSRFPSGAFAWRLSDEPFMKPLKKTINDAKVRVSYGLSGNNRISNYLFITQYAPNTYYYLNNIQNSAYTSTYLANPNLVWETTTKRNLGLDLSFLEGRISFSTDLYNNTTDNLLVNVAIPAISGYTTQLQNVGSSSNKGIEFQVNATILKLGAFRWNANYNMSFNQNRITSLGQQTSFLINSGWAGTNNPADYIAKVGESVGTMWGLVTDGFYKTSDFNYDPTTKIYTLKTGVPTSQSVTSSLPAPGTIKYKDLNGDGVVNDKDRTIIGHSAPKFYGGLHQNFTYKNFDLSVFVNFQYGGQVYNDNKLEFTNGYTTDANLLASTNSSWSTIDRNTGAVLQQVKTVNGTQVVVGEAPDVLNNANKNATLWTPLTSNSAFYPSSYAVEDASFLRINNISLGYNISSKILKRYKIQTFRAYVTVNNLAVITGYSGYDPEANTRRATPLTPGVDYSAYPRSKTYIFGVNLSF